MPAGRRKPANGDLTHAVGLRLHASVHDLAKIPAHPGIGGRGSAVSMTTLSDWLVKIGAMIVSHGRSITFQTAKVTVPDRRSKPLTGPPEAAADCLPGPMVTGSMLETDLITRRAHAPIAVRNSSQGK